MKKHLQARHDRNLELGRIDAANRCTFCRRALPLMGTLLMLTPSGDTLRYCDQGCREDHADALRVMEAR